MWKLVLLSLVSALLVANVSAACLSTTSSAAEVTYYGAYAGNGHCSLDGPIPPAGTHPSIFATIGIADNVYQNSLACGMCINITRKTTDPGSGLTPIPIGTYTVFINNECPTCSNNGIDLGLNGDGAWDVNWVPVPCPVGSTKLQFKYQGSNLYYLKVQVRNSRYPIQSLEVLQGGVFKPLVRGSDFFFVATGAPTAITFPLIFPLTVRVTATTGDQVIDSISDLVNDIIFQGTQQFPDCGSSGSISGSVASTSSQGTTVTTGKSATTSTTGQPATTGKIATSTTGNSATTTAKSSTTSVSSTTGSSSVTYTNMYMNGFENSFQDWSWSTTRNAADPNGYNSTIGYSFSPKANEAVYFHCSSTQCINTAIHSAVEFYFKSTVEAKDSISFALVQGGAGVGTKVLSSFVSSTTSWVKVTVPLSGFTAGLYDGLWWIAGSSTVPTVYVDSVRIIGK